MAPAYIADSDDESEGNSYSPPPAAQAEQPPSFCSKSDTASLATSSTDPTFFRNIYKEQIAAAREQQGHLSQLRGGQLQFTAPAGTEQTDPVSLPSQYPEDAPLTVGDANRGYSNALKSVIMREKALRQEDGGQAVDPWAVPSSAEEESMGSKKKFGWTMNVNSSVAYANAREYGASEDEQMRPPSRKRQRLMAEGQDSNIESSLPPTALPINSSLPPTMPISNNTAYLDNFDDLPSTLVPTMSIGNDPSLIINPIGLTNSQKEEYETLEVPVSSNTEQKQHLEQPHGESPNKAAPQSSAKSQRRKTPKKKTKSSQQKTKRRSVKPAITELVTESVQLGTPEQTQEGKPVVVLPDSEDEGYGEDGDIQGAPRHEPEDDVYEMQPSSVKETRKKRGRPERGEREETGTNTGLPEPMGPQNNRKQVMRRGRPKKSAQTVVEEEQEADEMDKIQNKPLEETKTGNDETADVVDTTAQDAPSPHKDIEVNPVVISRGTPQKPEHKKLATPQPGSTGKPIYRIGLSRRSRIAPLLKSLPK
ncbi:hypothetical protein NQ176_g9131 [Zarea fungicola]|uniref:Uncharacterized protein n=1 Tax=Zarea fungicola TaxID=93591 RepID=A0ACC1MNK6_9HYPO|nr:hypothetical protein NQ176_g9131 [Lecanicillium fungicola]